MILRNNNRTKKVIYDGRGAIKEEWKEYKVVKNAKLLEATPNLLKLEKELWNSFNLRLLFVIESQN